MVDTSTNPEALVINTILMDDSKSPTKSVDVAATVNEAIRIVTPVWPLQSIVAVNPFWNLREKGFYETLSQLSSVFGQSLFLPLEVFVKKYEAGLIEQEDIERAMASLNRLGHRFEGDFARFLRESNESTAKELSFSSYSDFVSRWDNLPLSSQVVDQVAKYCASYFDQGQAPFGLRTGRARLYEEWRSLIGIDSSMDYLGYPRDSDFLNSLPADPIAAIGELSKRLEVNSELSLQLYVMKCCHRLMGWCSHIQWHHWQESLGLSHNHRGTKIEDVVAMFMTYECWAKSTLSELDGVWREEHKKQMTTFSHKSAQLDHNYVLLSIWQRANEWAYQRQVARKLVSKDKSVVAAPAKASAQMIFCIDVRSEIIRRKIEAEASEVTTHGFAGFFGVTLDINHLQKESSSYRCPVLLTPKLKIQEGASVSSRSKFQGSRSFSKFLGGLKQGLVSSFAYVEFFGMLSGAKILKRALNWGARAEKLFKVKFDDSSEVALLADFEVQVATATFALTHLGIRDFSPVVVLCGHGSVTTNNAFGSSLDCGACGGHPGDLNARVLCRILNDKKVRDELLKRGQFTIPEDTRFVAAIHETVTDQILILEAEQLPAAAKTILKKITGPLAKASASAQKERALITNSAFVPGQDRVCNWSEVRPEWALAGNACFIVAPRSRTSKSTFQGRSFLHDYDFTADEGMKTLELIMTAPMVVTNWINMQYYASSTAMGTFGSGDKVLHNMVGRMGVTEGNSGDLRIGLPFQSVHSGDKLVHDPLRLSVFIEAPEAEVEKIVERHAVVQQLADNQWLHLFLIDRTSGKVSYRSGARKYEAVL